MSIKNISIPKPIQITVDSNQRTHPIVGEASPHHDKQWFFFFLKNKNSSRQPEICLADGTNTACKGTGIGTIVSDTDNRDRVKITLNDVMICYIFSDICKETRPLCLVVCTQESVPPIPLSRVFFPHYISVAARQNVTAVYTSWLDTHGVYDVYITSLPLTTENKDPDDCIEIIFLAICTAS